ncbi:WhiB family transcriptional regulator [Corynebacterium sp. HS2168-gen11]|uniref:WhiB family transcriptional regulator n=1 Tax=Corynebacterium sp. HS2168-gen11 TaxID=2974027 RepID=UPI00216B0506|nr:WhiB family transcriptional regulator [Corynebacterium sp. HS2168-gen11]MCS4535922.1 WhiB family transcriptional regulator [Corynebacterium sp. HS2168-gen11]
MRKGVRGVKNRNIHASIRVEWVTSAKCRKGDPDALFVSGAAQRRAALICQRCPVILHCRADALDNKVEFGVWGGLTERERRALLRNYPEITSWAEFYHNGHDHTGNL